MSNKINNKKELKEWINYEQNNYKSPKFKIFDQLFCISETSILRKFLKRLRKTEYYKNTNKKFLYFISKMKYMKMENKYSIHIPLNTCAKGLKIMHVGPILINHNAKIGENCSLHINTSIVAGGTNSEAPVLGNNIVLGVGAVVLGNIKLADNIAIGANAVVNKSFLEESITIAGVPAKKISNNGSFTWKNKR